MVTNTKILVVFIVKYTHIRRILAPLAATLDQIPPLVNNEGIKNYIEKTFGYMWNHYVRLFYVIFFDMNLMVVDGRLISLMDWCSKLR